MSDQQTGSGCGREILGCGVVGALLLLGLVGAGYLYQREGGKLFDKVEAINEPPPLLLEGDKIEVKVNPGIMTHDIIVVNQSDNILTETTVTILILKKDGSKLEHKAYWEKWVPGESKKVNVTASGTRTSGFGLAVTGEGMTKTRDGRKQKAVIVSAWEMKKRWE